MIKRLFFVIMTLIILGGLSVKLYMGSSGREEVNPLTYFSEFKTGQNNLVFEDIRIALERPVIEKDGMIYISHEVLKTYVDDTVYYDSDEGILSITNVEEVIRLYRNSSEIKINDEKKQMKDKLLEEGAIAYVPQSFLIDRYNFEVTKGADNRLYIASNTEVSKQSAIVKEKKAKLRTHPDKKSLITDEMTKDHELIIYAIEEGFARVRNENGIIGYISEKDIKMTGATEVKAPKTYSKKPLNKPIEGKVKLVWDQMGSKIVGEWNGSKYTKIKGANVISPTWFEFEDAEGNLMDRGTEAYVKEAQSRDLQVWALMSHNFTEPQFTKEILKSTNKRQHVINQLLEAADDYALDGINIDIENIQQDFSEDWVQFMRELYPQANRKGIAVSVDVYMPSAWSGHYERAKISEVVDYFIVMAYDQHWSGSETAGPVAALDWVEEGIQGTLQEVPKEKLVLGMPFFARVWEESSEGLSSKAYSMDTIQGAIKKWGVEPIFDQVAEQYYAETVQNGITKKVWIEDATSIANRTELVKEYDLAGYGAWKLGLETSDIWEILNKVE